MSGVSDGGVLVIRPGALGDTILTLPLLRTIRARHPDAKVIFLATGAYKSLVPREIEFHPIDGMEWLWLFGAERDARSADVSRWEGAYVVLAKPDTMVSHLRRGGLNRIHHTTSIPSPGRHLVETIHEGLGLPIPPRAAALLRETGTPRQKQSWPSATTRHESALSTSQEPSEGSEPTDIPGLFEVPPRRPPCELLWIHPGSGGARKCLPLAEMARLCLVLREAAGWDLVITLGEADSFVKLDPAWKILARTAARVLESQPLDKLATELGRSSAYVGNDSGISHLAAAFGIPSLIFYAATDPVCWSPWVPDRQLITVDLRGREPSINARGLTDGLLSLTAVRGNW